MFYIFLLILCVPPTSLTVNIRMHIHTCTHAHTPHIHTHTPMHPPAHLPTHTHAHTYYTHTHSLPIYSFPTSLSYIRTSYFLNKIPAVALRTAAVTWTFETVRHHFITLSYLCYLGNTIVWRIYVSAHLTITNKKSKKQDGYLVATCYNCIVQWYGWGFLGCLMGKVGSSLHWDIDEESYALVHSAKF